MKISIMAVLMALALAGRVEAQWQHTTRGDHLGLIKTSISSAWDQNNVQWHLTVFYKNRLKNVWFFVPTASNYLCRSSSRKLVDVSINIDGTVYTEKWNTRTTDSGDNQSNYYLDAPYSSTNAWIQRLSNGNRMWVRIHDVCGDFVDLEFSIQGRPHLGEPNISDWKTEDWLKALGMVLLYSAIPFGLLIYFGLLILIVGLLFLALRWAWRRIQS